MFRQDSFQFSGRTMALTKPTIPPSREKKGRNQQTLAAAMSKTEEFTIGEKKKPWNALSTSGRETKGPIIEETPTNEKF